MKRSWWLAIAAGIVIAAMSALQYLKRPGAGDEAPHFEAASVEGGVVSLAELRGSPVILHFWASWCGPCRDEMPALARLKEDYGESGLAVLAIALDERPEDAVRAAESLAPGLTVLLDPEGKIADAYHSFGVPDNVFIDGSGVIVWRRAGHLDWDSEKTRSRIEELIGG